MLVPHLVLSLAEAVRAAGGRLFVVGGAVRDHALGLPAKDLDLEVHGLDDAALAPLLRRHGTARRVGRAFAVYKLGVPGAGELDVALPRGDAGATDPIAEAARHRDLTVNALLHDPLTGETLDPWGGLDDLAAGRLRAVDPDAFRQDPARALRVAVFAARLSAQPDPALVALCRSLDVSGQPPERLGIELQKLWLRASRPSIGLDWIGRLGLADSVLPGVELGVQVGAAVDRAVSWYDVLEEDSPGARLALVWAVLLRGHADPEAVLARCGVHTVGRWPLRQRVISLVQDPAALPIDDPGLRRLAERHPVWLALRSHAAWEPAGPALALLARASMLGVAVEPLPALLRGRDLLALGVEAGPALGRWLGAVREAQLDGALSTPSEARTWVAARIGCAVEFPPAQDEPAE